MYTTYLKDEIVIGSYDKDRSSSLSATNAGLNVKCKIIDLREYSFNGTFDIFILHGYQIQEFLIDFKSFTHHIKCNTFVIDLMGEYQSDIGQLREYQKFIDTFIECNEVKVIGVYEDTDNVRFRDWKFFKHKLAWQFFINPHNNTFHRWTVNPPKVICGSKWKGGVKQNLFQCLNNTMRPHRVLLVNEILKSDIKSKYILSSREGNYDGVKSPNISVDNIVESETAGTHEESRFGLQTQFSDKCYIDVETETKYESKFVTEKSVKPFYNLQIPILFGYSGIVKYFKDLGFDMFDDIINHNYDKELDIHIKSKMIADELLRLSKIDDFHSLYINCKERLLANQNLLNYYNFSSKRHDALARFLFGDNFYIMKSDKNFNTLYL